MPKELDLEELGNRLKMVDSHLVAILAQRMELAKLVEEYKRQRNDKLIRFKTEDERIEGAKALAKAKGLNPNFIAAFQYLIMAEACRVEIFQMQDEPKLKEKKLSPAQLKENLLALTKEIAPLYDQNYGLDFFATRSYLAFEESIIDREIGTLKVLGMLDSAIDLGCATGKISLKIAKNFQRVVGYDISPEMVAEAKKNIQKDGALSNIEFRVADIEKEIPEQSNSASLVVMSLGTAGDILNMRQVLAKIKRILKPDGRLILSFYNSSALLYRCWFFPWQVSLAASVNQSRHCLDVHLKDRVFSIYARPYSVWEIKKLLNRAGFEKPAISTYPTISAILPNEFFEEESMQKLISDIDHQLADLESGAYALATARKGTS